MIAVDLGSRTTKAVCLQRRGSGYALTNYALFDAPIFDKALSAELLTEHLKSVNTALGSKGKMVTLTVGVTDALVRPVDMPVLAPEEMRMVLKLNSRNYLQQDLSNYIFDCQPLLTNGQGKPVDAKAAGIQKQRVLVAGARRQLVDDFVEGATGAGLIADRIVPGLIGPVNAFEKAMPEAFKNEVVALVDIGFKNSSICILNKGDLSLTRTVNIGGDKLTNALSEHMSISYAEAEGIKIGMPQEVQTTLETVLTPLGRELRASIDFFEHQQDKALSRVYLSGGSARSSVIVQALQTELMVECTVWNPAESLKLELSPEQAAQIEQLAPQLTVAIGAAFSAL